MPDQQTQHSAAVRGSQAVERVLGILTTFTMEKPALGLKEICARTGLTMPTAHRMIKALQKADFVTQHPTLGTYSLGPAVMELARIVMGGQSQSMLAATCMPYLDELRNASGESAGLHIVSAQGRICVAEAESRQMMRMSTGVGTTFPWYAGAASKAVLAAMSPAEREAILLRSEWRAITGTTPRDIKSLLNELVLVADQGFAMSFGETVEGAAAIAVAVRGPDQRVIAAINVTGPAIRWSKDDMIAFVPQLRAAVRQIERQIGAR